MEDGGGLRWQDEVEADLRPRMVQQIIAMLVKTLKTSPTEGLQKYVAQFEMGVFMAAKSKMEYMSTISLHVSSFQKQTQAHLHKPAAQAQPQQCMHMTHPVQLANRVQAIQGGNSSFAAIPQTVPMMASPARSPFQSQNRHMASPFAPDMQVNVNQTPSDMMEMLYQALNPQPATVAPVEQIVQSGQQVMQPIPMQSHSQCPAIQLQPTNIAQFHPASTVQLQLQGHQIAWPNDVYHNHLLMQAQNLQPTLQQQHFGIPQQQVGMQSNQMLGANVAKMNDAYYSGWNNHQNAGCASGIQSPLKECEQVVLKKQTNMESEFMPPAQRQITVSQQGNGHCPNPQHQARMESDGEVDWRDEMLQQIKSLKDAYFLELKEFDQNIVVHRLIEEQFKLLPREKADTYNHVLRTKSCITNALKFLQIEKSIDEKYKGKLPSYEKLIGRLISCHRKRKANAQMNTGQESMSCPRQPQPQTINLTADIAPFTGGKSNQQKLLVDESIGQMRQNVVGTPSAGQKTHSNQLQGVTIPRFSTKSPGVSQSSPNNEVGLFCKRSPIDKLEVASPTMSLNSTLASTIEKSGFLAAASPCASVKSASPSDIKKSGIVPVASPSYRDSSFLLHNNAGVNGYNQTTPTKLLTPDSPFLTQKSVGEADDQEYGGAETLVTKKPIDRLIAAVISSSPEVLRSSVNLMKSAIREMDSVPLRTGSNNKIKRIYDVTSPSASPTVGSMDGSTVTFEMDALDSASSRYISVKRQKTQDTRVALLDEIEAVNSRLIDTVLSITSDGREDGTTSCNGMTMVKLSYTGVALAPSLKSQLATSGNLQPLMLPMTLLIPADYPRSSPVIMDDEGDARLRTKFSCISVVVDSSFRVALRSLKEPRSLTETARVWDSCVRRAVIDYAYQLGGGTLSTSLGHREGWVAA